MKLHKRARLGFGVPLTSAPFLCSDYWAACCDMLIYTMEQGLFSEIKTFRVSSSSVAINRNKIWRMAKEAKCDYLLMIDNDMVFRKNLVEKLLEVEKVMPNCVYTGMACVGGKPWYPAVWAESPEDGKGMILWDWPRHQRFEVHFIGAFGFLVPKSILYSKKLPEDPFCERDGRSEDHSFSKEVRNAGFRLICDPTIEFGHLRLQPVTPKWWDEEKQGLDPRNYVTISSRDDGL